MTTPLRLFLGGDVMTGRGIDQILPHPSDPRLYEDCMASALGYVALAEEANGAIPRSVPPSYVWGDLLPVLDRRKPDLRIANLETAITRSDRPEDKGINYRMNPANVGVLAAAGFDGLSLANNHVMDWGRAGLTETCRSLDHAGIGHAGAGEDAAAATAPLRLGPDGRTLAMLAFALSDSGVPGSWAAGPGRSGVALLDPDPDRAVAAVAAATAAIAPAPDAVLVSIHWGGNWGYEIPAAHRTLAQGLIDAAGVDIVHGHSSHHHRAIEVYRGRPILYGCGDLLNDYEGIGGQERYRTDLVMGYVVDLDLRTRRCCGIEMLPFALRRFRLHRADGPEVEWLLASMGRECARFGGRVTPTADGTLALRPDG